MNLKFEEKKTNNTFLKIKKKADYRKIICLNTRIYCTALKHNYEVCYLNLWHIWLQTIGTTSFPITDKPCLLNCDCYCYIP